jgi:hypothetical protein
VFGVYDLASIDLLGIEFEHDVAAAIFDAADGERPSVLALIREGGKGSGHFKGGDFAATQGQG